MRLSVAGGGQVGRGDGTPRRRDAKTGSGRVEVRMGRMSAANGERDGNDWSMGWCPRWRDHWGPFGQLIWMIAEGRCGDGRPRWDRPAGVPDGPGRPTRWRGGGAGSLRWASTKRGRIVELQMHADERGWGWSQGRMRTSYCGRRRVSLDVLVGLFFEYSWRGFHLDDSGGAVRGLAASLGSAGRGTGRPRPTHSGAKWRRGLASLVGRSSLSCHGSLAVGVRGVVGEVNLRRARWWRLRNEPEPLSLSKSGV